MFWIGSFFKVVDEYKGRYILEINPSIIYRNIDEFEDKSNYSNLLSKEIHRLKNANGYDERISSLKKITDKIYSFTKVKIFEKEFKLIKFDYFNKLFYIEDRDFEENFIKDENSGMITVNDNSTFLTEKNLVKFSNYSTPHELEVADGAASSLELRVLSEAKLLDLENGLSVIGLTRTKEPKSVGVGIIFDAGNAYSKRVIHAKKIIDFFDSRKIKKIVCILSHEHMDHYNIFSLKIMGKWLSKLDSTAIYYEDINIMSKLNFIASCKNKVPLKRENKIIKFGDVKIKTFKSIAPVDSKDQNKASMVLHSGKMTFTGDQDYASIPKAWMIKQDFFQVPHHGSAKSGNYKLAKNNKNALPSFVNAGLPVKKVKKYFEVNNSVLRKY